MSEQGTGNREQPQHAPVNPVEAALRGSLAVVMQQIAQADAGLLQGVAAAMAWEAKHPGTVPASTTEQMQKHGDYFAGLDKEQQGYFAGLAGWLILSTTSSLAETFPLVAVAPRPEPSRILTPGLPHFNGGPR